MALNVSAFSAVRNNSISSDGSDGKTSIHFPKNESSSFSAPAYIPWWSSESPMVKPPLWSWWGLQNHRLSNLYSFPHFAGASDDEKPSQSYIGLIAEAILSSPEEKLILSDIYGFILANYPYFRNKGTGWRNSIRHNLSLNDCFVKAGRSQNGKGHFWAVSHLYIDDFRRGDFRRKRTYRRPSRGKKARAKLEALKRKAASKYLETPEENNKNEIKFHKDDTMQHEQDPVQDKILTLKTEQFDGKIVEDPNIVKVNREKVEDFLEPEQFCREPRTANERVVPCSPEWKTEFQEIEVCSTDYEKDTASTTDCGESQPLLEDSRKIEDMRVEDSRARRSKPFDMDTLLATDRNSKDLGILREMYPMYYNIMNLGMRNLDPLECYGSSQGYCGHCCSMLGSFPSHHRELRRPMYTMASYGTVPIRHDECKREYME